MIKNVFVSRTWEENLFYCDNLQRVVFGITNSINRNIFLFIRLSHWVYWWKMKTLLLLTCSLCCCVLRSVRVGREIPLPHPVIVSSSSSRTPFKNRPHVEWECLNGCQQQRSVFWQPVVVVFTVLAKMSTNLVVYVHNMDRRHFFIVFFSHDFFQEQDFSD